MIMLLRNYLRSMCCVFRYLLLEDGDTGDMLIPLVYMKSVFQANYSRKLSSPKNRLVVIPSDQKLSGARSNTFLYWQWAFESPLNVKLLVRQELGEENFPQASQAHLSLLTANCRVSISKKHPACRPRSISEQCTCSAATSYRGLPFLWLP